MGAEWSAPTTEKRPLDDVDSVAGSTQPTKKRGGAPAHPHPGDLQDVTLLSSSQRNVSYTASYNGANAQEVQRALLVVSQPSLDPETAGNTLVSAAAANNAKEIFRNDKYSKFDLSIPTTWRAEVVCPASDRDVQKYSEQSFQIIRETPEMYNKVTKPFIDGISAKAIEWVYNILDGKKESENVIASHKDYMIVKDYKWSDEAKVTAMHVLGMPMEKGELKSIRDLRGKHIPLLKAMQDAGIGAVQDKYGIPASAVRCYFHYLPTFYHLHIHFDHIAGGGHGGHTVGKAVLLDDVIDALERDGDHFTKASLTFHAGAVRDKKILTALDEAGLA